MSPRSRTGLIASRLVGGALLLAMLPAGTVRAQAPTDGMPFESIVDSSSYLGQTPFRAWHRTRGYGEETAETALGTHWATPTAGGLGFIDGQLRVGNTDQDFSLNFGGGFRWRNDDYFTNSPRILGVSFWYDGEDTELNNYFNQLGVSFERLGPLVDLRFNANFPLEEIKQGDNVELTGDPVFVGGGIAQSTIVEADASLRTVDFEIAPRLFNLNAWLYAGGYQMDGEGVSEFGEKGGVRGYLMNDLVLDVGVNDDDLFGTTTVVQIIWTPGRVTADPSSWVHSIDDRMREQVYRNPYVAVTRTQVMGSQELTDNEGEAFDIVHVDSTAPEGGDGTIETPFNDLADVNANTEIGDIIFVHSESSFTGQSVTLKDAQRFLGEGNNEEHLIVTSQLGEIALPESAPGAGALAKPEIVDSPAPAAIILAGGNMEVEALAEIEVSNFTIDGGTRGIFSPTGVADVNINRMMIMDTTGDGIELTPLVETLANSTTRVRFTPSITDSMFTNVGGDDIDLNATTMEPAATPIVEAIAISDIESDDGNGVGIRLTEHKRAATITDFNWDGGTTGDGALLIDNTLNTGTVAMNGTNTITAGTVGSAFAISLEGGAAVHTVGGTTITNMGGDAIVANGPGTAGLNFTGRIEQTANAASILSITGGHDGNMTFTELTAGAGVINATIGDGLQFNDADGVYTFNDKVTITGGAGTGATSAVNVAGDSTGVITLTDATFTNINGDAITFAGGSANMTLTGQVQQTANAQSILSVTGGHTGTLTFNELTANTFVINATTGDGLQFNDADGTYLFNDEVQLNGGDAGVDVLNDSEGTFTFANADIDFNNVAPGAAAVLIDDSNVQAFTMSGEVTATNGRPFAFTNNEGGSVTINATVTGNDEGILVNNNSGGTFRFSGQTAMTTGANDAVFIQNNTGGSIRFDNLQATTTSGTGFLASNVALPGMTVEVTGTANTITTTTGVGLNLNNVNVGANGVAFASVNVSNGGSNGVVLNNVTGGPVTIGSGAAAPGGGGTMLTADEAVLITNAANVTLNRLNITGTGVGDNGIEINHDNGLNSTVVVTNSIITNTGAVGIDYNRSASATSRLTLTGNTISATGDQGIAIGIDGTSDANITINGGNNVTNSSGDEALLVTTTGAAGKTVRIAVTSNTFTNNSSPARTVDFLVEGTTSFNANVTGNFITNSDLVDGRAFEMETNSATADAHLHLDANNAVSANAGDYLLENTAGTFTVQAMGTVDARNGGDVQFVGTIGTETGPVPSPQ